MRGFSLVELSIVLVILGLLTGGILTGRNLIRAAELRSVITDIQRYQTAIYTFRDAYSGLPGDIRNATDFWGEAHADPTTCATTESTSALTCNGNGDGKLSNTVGHAHETFRAWQHLANAGMAEGSYAGISLNTTSAYVAKAGYNVPAGKISSSLFCFRYASGSSLHFASTDGNSIYFGTNAGTNTDCDSPVLSTGEAWNVDKKNDDGRPGTGKIRSFNADSRPCASDNDPTIAEYRLDRTDNNSCNLVILTGF
jgi:prepilin-type N-terminal cleavage/methylation domain-containing protein